MSTSLAMSSASTRPSTPGVSGTESAESGRAWRRTSAWASETVSIVPSRRIAPGTRKPVLGGADGAALLREERSAKVPFPEIGQDHHDHLTSAVRPLGYLHGSPRRRAATDAAQDPFLASQPPRHLKGILVANL